MDISTLPWKEIGGALGLLITGGGLATIVGQVLTSRLDTKKLEASNRGHSDDILKTQIDNLWTRVEDLQATVSYLRARDVIFAMSFAAINGEMRLLNGLLGMQMGELGQDAIDKKALIDQVNLMRDTVERVQRTMAESQEQLTHAASTAKPVKADA